jgi:hypothetical protein
MFTPAKPKKNLLEDNELFTKKLPVFTIVFHSEEKV